MDIGSKQEIARLRSQARKEGIAIRTQRRSGSSNAPVFDLIDRESGTVLIGGVQDVAGLETQLASIVAGRTSSPPTTDPAPVREAPEVRCPSCGTRRVAQFRWCRACGLDFEAYKQPAVEPEPEPEPEETPPAEEPSMTRRARLVDAVWDAYLFGPWRQVVGVALAAVLAGVLVTVMINAVR